MLLENATPPGRAMVPIALGEPSGVLRDRLLGGSDDRHAHGLHPRARDARLRPERLRRPTWRRCRSSSGTGHLEGGRPRIQHVQLGEASESEAGGPGSAPLDTAPLEYVNYPSAGSRFVAGGPPIAFAFGVYDLIRGRTRSSSVTRPPRRPTSFGRTSPGDLLVWTLRRGRGRRQRCGAALRPNPPMRSPRLAAGQGASYRMTSSASSSCSSVRRPRDVAALDHDLADGLALGERLLRDLGGLLVAEVAVQRGDDRRRATRRTRAAAPRWR